MSKRRLPIGLQTFAELRGQNCYYVDKTSYIAKMLDEGKHYFLSRPRRFGKSLFLDTLKEMFEGNERLFQGLDIHGKRDWSVRHPVLRLSFGGGNFKEPRQVEANMMDQLAAAERRAGVASEAITAAGRLGSLLEALHRDAGQPVAVLIDEYDKPILDALDAPETARANRDFLRGVYAVIKDRDGDVQFTFVTGVSKFSGAFSRGARGACPSQGKVSLFSGLNNLTDITMDPRYSAICGYTDADLDTVFAPELAGLDRNEVRDWYNGYNWRGDDPVYNPFDILLLFRSREYKAHWFETGSPTFLVETLFERRVASVAIEAMMGTDDLLSRFDVGDIATEALLFQTGYLTIAKAEPRGGEIYYQLGYPNREVRESLSRSLLNRMTGDTSKQVAHSARLYDLMLANDFDGLRALIHAFFASIPHQWYTNNDIANYEGFYASVFYSYFAGLGLDIAVEDSSSHGRLDMAVRFNGRVYLFEFKVVELAPDGAAMAQLKNGATRTSTGTSASPSTSSRWSSAGRTATWRRSRSRTVEPGVGGFTRARNPAARTRVSV